MESTLDVRWDLNHRVTEHAENGKSGSPTKDHEEKPLLLFEALSALGLAFLRGPSWSFVALRG
jgi:hypothetical protein